MSLTRGGARDHTHPHVAPCPSPSPSWFPNSPNSLLFFPGHQFFGSKLSVGAFQGIFHLQIALTGSGGTTVPAPPPSEGPANQANWIAIPSVEIQGGLDNYVVLCTSRSPGWGASEGPRYNPTKCRNPPPCTQRPPTTAVLYTPTTNQRRRTS